MRDKTSIDLVLDKLQKIAYEAHDPTNHILNTFHKRPKLLADVAGILDELGSRDLEFLGKGKSSLALLNADNQVIRIYNKSSERIRRPYHPAILQPIKTIHLRRGLSHLVIEILPKVLTEGVTAEHVSMVNEALYRSGISVGDLGMDGNVGLLPLKDGRKIPVLIDPGCARQFMKPHDGIEHLKDWLAEDGSWLQKQYDSGRDSPGVIEKLDRFEVRMRGPKSWIEEKYQAFTGRNLNKRRVSQTIEGIRDGLSDEDIGAIHEKARERLDDKKDSPSYSELIEKERKALIASRSKRDR